MIHEKIIINEDRNVKLNAFIYDLTDRTGSIPDRPVVIVLPGGGYENCAKQEGEPVAMAFLKGGFNTFVLEYSVGHNEGDKPGNGCWPNPLHDYDDAVEYIISRADEWHIDPEKIAICGFSAGGHLGSAVISAAEHKPKAAILGYPVVTEQVKEVHTDAPETISLINENTSPCFIFSTRDDPVVPVTNSLKFMMALAEHGVPFESHIYSHGPHAFGTCDRSIGKKDICPRVPNWVADATAWLCETMHVFE